MHGRLCVGVLWNSDCVMCRSGHGFPSSTPAPITHVRHCATTHPEAAALRSLSQVSGLNILVSTLAFTCLPTPTSVHTYQTGLHKCMHVQLHTYTCMHVHMCVHTHTYMHVHVCIYLHTHTHKPHWSWFILLAWVPQACLSVSPHPLHSVTRTVTLWTLLLVSALENADLNSSVFSCITSHRVHERRLNKDLLHLHHSCLSTK